MTSRVLHVAAVDFTVAKLLTPQLDYLRSRGCDVRVACRQTDARYWRDLDRFAPIDIPFPRQLEPMRMINSSRALSRVVRAWEPNVLHLHTPAASMPIRALPHPTWSPNTKVFYTVHGFLHTWPPKGAKERLVQRVEQWEARRTHTLLFQSEEDFRAAVDNDYLSNLVLLGNGVEDHWFDIPPRRRRRGRLELLFVGRIVREKGILDLLHAVASVPEVHLHVAGEALDSDRDPVSADVAALLSRPELTGRVTMHGMLARPDLQVLVNRVEALCLPSYREGVPRSVIEALAASRPVIVTDIRGSRELVRDGDNGFVAQAGSVSDLRSKIRKLAVLDGASYDAMSTSARNSVDPHRRESAVFGRLAEAYTAAGVCLK